MSNRLEYAPLGELLEDTQYGMSIPSSPTGSVPMFKMNNFDNGYMNPRGVDLVSISSTDFEQFKLNHGDILFNRTNSLELVGKSGIFTLSGDYVFASYLVRLIPDRLKINPFFLNFYLNNETTKTELKRLATKGVSQANINPTQLKKKLLVPIFSLAEQTKIAQILSTWDKAIATTERLLANSQQQKQALMQELLTRKKRIAGFIEDWKNCSLGQLFNERNETNRPDLPLLSITTEQGVIDRADSGKKDTSSEDKSKYRRICPGDIGYNTMRMWQGVSGLSDKEGIVSPAYTILQTTDLADSKFASYLFKIPALVHVFMRHSQGLVSDTWNLKYEHFAKIKVFVPSVPEQQKIAQVLSTADAEIANLQAQLAKLRLEKKALMQQLLTGQRRVRLDDEVEQTQARRVG